MHWLALFDLIPFQVLSGYDSAAGLDEIGNLVGHCAAIELFGIRGNALQCSRQFRLLEYIALVPPVAVVLKDPFRVSKARQIRLRNIGGLVIMDLSGGVPVRIARGQDFEIFSHPKRISSRDDKLVDPICSNPWH